MSRIVGLTSTPTTSRVILLDSKHEASVCCAADILLTGLTADVKGEATCPECGTTIGVSVRENKVVSVAPESSVLYYVEEEMKGGLGICCAQTFMFDKRPCLDAWLRSARPRKGRVTSFQGFLDYAALRRAPRRGVVKRKRL